MQHPINHRPASIPERTKHHGRISTIESFPYLHRAVFLRLQVTANDSDCGVNAKVNYTFGEEADRPKEFEIKPDSGDICVVTSLDYERRKIYEFPVIASDRGKLENRSLTFASKVFSHVHSLTLPLHIHPKSPDES